MIKPVFKVGIVLVWLLLVGSSCAKATDSPQSPLTSPDTLIISDGVQKALEAPEKLVIGGNELDLLITYVQEDDWEHQADQTAAAKWLYGTTINYVLGLEHTEDNQVLLEGLNIDAEVQLHLPNKRTLDFRVVSNQREPQETAADLFKQDRPRLTLVLFGGNEPQRLVVVADYISQKSEAD